MSHIGETATLQPLSTAQSGYRVVSPHEMVEVHHRDHWLQGELEAWWNDGERWHGLVKFYLIDGGSKYRWFVEDGVIARGSREATA